jgi:hypothetical protein
MLKNVDLSASNITCVSAEPQMISYKYLPINIKIFLKKMYSTSKKIHLNYVCICVYTRVYICLEESNQKY